MRAVPKTSLLCFVTALWLAGSAARGRCADIPKQWTQDDKRLLAPVTFTASSMYLGELLERLAKQTGVALTADNHDASSGTLVTVHWTQVPLADALNSLWSLLSYHNAEWTWEPIKTKEGATYRLLRPGAAREFGSYLKTLVFAAYEEQTTLLASAGNMSPEQIKGLLKAHPELKDCHLDDAERLLQWRMYAALPEATRRGALTNPDGVHVPIADLTAEARDYLISDWKTNPGYRTTQRAGQEPETVREPPPTGIHVTSVASTMTASQFSPYLTLFVDHGEEGGSGCSFTNVMVLHDALRAKFEALWLLPGDNKHEAVEARSLPAQKEGEPGAALSHGHTFEKLPRAERERLNEVQHHMVDYRLTQIADAAPLSYTARVGREQWTTYGYGEVRPGMKLAEWLNDLKDSDPTFIHKWRNGILLLSDCSWYHNNDNAPTPYEIVSALRTAEKTNGGFVPLRSLAMAAELLSPEQLKQLKTEFPVMANVAVTQEVFRFYYHDAAWEHAGAALTPAIVEILSALPGGINSSGRKGRVEGDLIIFERNQRNTLPDDLKKDGVVSVRLLDVRHKQYPWYRDVEVQLLSADGSIVSRYGFQDEKRKPANDAGFQQAAN